MQTIHLIFTDYLHLYFLAVVILSAAVIVNSK